MSKTRTKKPDPQLSDAQKRAIGETHGCVTPGVPAPAPPPPADDVLPLAVLREHPDNPRKTFPPAELEELAASLKADGFDQRLVVRPVGHEGCPPPWWDPGRGWLGVAYWQVLDGHRRLRAARLAGLTEAPVDVRQLDDAKAYLLMLRAFSQRTDPPASEQALAFARAAAQGRTAEEVAEATGKPVKYVRGVLRLARLPGWALAAVDAGTLPRFTAELVARVPGAEARRRAAACVLLGKGDPADLLPVHLDALEKYPTDYEHGGTPLTSREAAELIRTHFTRELKGAPFDRTSLGLLPAAGSCDACPSRAGNDPEALADGTRADTCLDPDCYRRKVEAYKALELAKAAERKILIAPDDLVWPATAGAPPKGYQDLAAKLMDCEGLWDRLAGNMHDTPLKKALGRFCPQAYLVFDPATEKPRFVVKTAEARRALQDAGVIKPEKKPKSPPPASPIGDLVDRACGVKPGETKPIPKSVQFGGPEHQARVLSAEVDAAALVAACKVLGEYGGEQFSGFDELADAEVCANGPILQALRLVTRAFAYEFLGRGQDFVRVLKLSFPDVHGDTAHDAADARLLDGIMGWESAECLATLLQLAAACELRFDGPQTPTAEAILDFAELDWGHLQESARRELAGGESADEKPKGKKGKR